MRTTIAAALSVAALSPDDGAAGGGGRREAWSVRQPGHIRPGFVRLRSTGEVVEGVLLLLAEFSKVSGSTGAVSIGCGLGGVCCAENALPGSGRDCAGTCDVPAS